MSNDPFSRQPSAYAAADMSYRPPSSRWVYVLLGLILGLILLLVLAVVGGIWAYSNAGFSAARDVPKPQPLAHDAESFQSGLQRQLFVVDPAAAATSTRPQPIDPSVRAWIEQTLNGIDGDSYTYDVPRHDPMFMQAVKQSRFATTFGFQQRIALKLSLPDSFPLPEVSEFYTLLSVDRQTDPATGALKPYAVANLLFYDGYSEASSVRWFLCQVDGDWKLYDWERLEYGRRVSDEWANYLANLNSGLEDAYDTQIVELGEIIASAADVCKGDPGYDMLLDRIRRVERRPVLPADRLVRDLRIVWTYQTVGDYEESLRLLNQISSSGPQWGVLASRSNALLALERYDEAIVAANEFLRLAPDQPNAHETISLAYHYSDREDQALPHLLKLLAVCPEHAYARQRLVEIAGPADLPAVLRICLASRSSDEQLVSLVEQRFTDQWQPTELFDQWRNTQSEFKYLPASFWQLIEAAEAIDSDDVALVEERLQQARRDSPMVFADLATAQLRLHYLRSKQFDDLIALVGIEKLVDQTIISGYDDEAPEPELLAALLANELTQASRWIDLLRGMAWEESRADDAITACERMLDSLEGNATSNAADDSEFTVDLAYYAKTWCQDFVLQQMLREGRVVAALERFAEDRSMLDTITQYLVSNPTVPEMSLAIEKVAQLNDPELAMALEELRAAEQMAKGDFEGANQSLLNAIQIAGENFSNANVGIADGEEAINWTQTQLITRRVDYALQGKAYTLLQAADRENVTELIEQLARRGTVVCDSEAIVTADAMLNAVESPEVKTQMQIAFNNLAAHHRVHEAIANVTRIASDAETYKQPDRVYAGKGYAPEFIDALIYHGWLDDAERVLDAAALPDRWLDQGQAKKYRAAVSIRRQDASVAPGLLMSLPTDDAARLLSEAYIKPTLVANPDFAQELYNCCKPLVSQELGDNAVIVIEQSPRRPDREQIQTWVHETFSQDSVVESVMQADSVATYVVDVATVGRLLITISDRKLKSFNDYDIDVAKRLIDADHVLVIERIVPAFRPLADANAFSDDAFDVQRLLWTFATNAITASTLAIYSERASAFWVCDASSPATLTWSDRLPIERAVNADVVLHPINVDDTGQPVSLRRLRRAIAAGQTQVTFNLNATSVSERLEGELISVERSGGRATIRLKTDSQFDPTLRSGSLVMVSSFAIKLASPPAN